MGWFRSAEMSYVSFQFNKDAAHRTVERLGKLGTVQFTDKNAGTVAFQRAFTEPIRRCDELERRLRFFDEEMARQAIEPSAARADYMPLGHADLLRELDTTLAERERDLNNWLSSLAQLRRERNHQREQIEVLKFGREFLSWSDDADKAGQGGADAGYYGGDNSNSAEGGGGGMFGARQRKGSKERSLLGDMGVGGSDGGGGMGNVVQRVGGVVKSEVKEKMSRMLFRVSRGNALVVFNEIEEPMLADAAAGGGGGAAAAVAKHAFVVVVSSEVLERKVRKVMEAFDANKYELPENVAECERLLAEGRAQHDEQRELVERNGAALRAALLRLASETASWKCAVRREKATYHTLNLFRAPEGQGKGGGGNSGNSGNDGSGGGGTLDAELNSNGGSSRFEAEGWVVSSALPAVRQAVLEAHREMPSVVETVQGRALPTPPTHFALNKFSAGFQALVDTYGVPRYREANPALFTAITFPFLFGVMYGDVGHGSCLLLFGLLLVATEKAKEGKTLGELEGGLHLARYMILLMGVFAVYSGFIYNDFFGLGLDLGEGSRWRYPAGPGGEPAEVGTLAKTVGAGGAVQPDCGYENKTGAAMGGPGASCPQDGNVYPFGLDPMWHTASNELLMANSLKMKMSVILGITQMVAGILLKGANCLHVGDRVSFFLDFLPQLVFASALFAYMIVLILIKWSIDWQYRMALVTPTSACPAELGGCQPPNLITTLINIVLKIGDVTDPMYEGQAGTQTFLVLMCVLSVPVMLCGKPLYLRWENQRNPRVPVLIDEHDGGMDQAETSFVRHGSDADEHGPPAGGHGHGPFDFGELMIHQGIETIEFVLGMVSNTASYLRLWALSLAHTELAGVFWHKVMLVAINTKNPFFIFIAFTIFAAITTAVLLMMDVLECFLHALRLHWVEFQNKFFAADGYKFTPLDFAALDKEVM